MNELGRSAYLAAMGVDNYVSRRPLPAARPSRRAQLIVTARSAPADTVPGGEAGAPVTAADIAGSLRPSPPGATRPARVGAGALQTARSERAEVPRFTLAAVVAGSVLWLEELAGQPLAREQVQLIAAMAAALQARGAAAGEPAAPDVALFDWPIHTNRQLELDAEAARAGVAAFLARRVQQHDCRGLVLLGTGPRQWVVADSLDLPVIATAGTFSMLQQPVLKAEVWRQLAPLRQR